MLRSGRRFRAPANAMQNAAQAPPAPAVAVAPATTALAALTGGSGRAPTTQIVAVSSAAASSAPTTASVTGEKRPADSAVAAVPKRPAYSAAKVAENNKCLIEVLKRFPVKDPLVVVTPGPWSSFGFNTGEKQEYVPMDWNAWSVLLDTPRTAETMRWLHRDLIGLSTDPFVIAMAGLFKAAYDYSARDTGLYNAISEVVARDRAFRLALTDLGSRRAPSTTLAQVDRMAAWLAEVVGVVYAIKPTTINQD